MAKNPICSMEECGKPTVSKGLCSAHYTKLLRHGDASVSRRVANGTHERWIRENSTYSGKECLIWPFSAKSGGYGMASLQGRGLMAAHRFMCIVVNGEPAGKQVSAHICGNGAGGCVAPNHIRWASYRENSADQYGHGTAVIGEKNHKAVINTETAKSVYSSSLGYKQIAEKFGVSLSLVRSIKNGHTWSWATGHEKYIQPSRILPSP